MQWNQGRIYGREENAISSTLHKRVPSHLTGRTRSGRHVPHVEGRSVDIVLSLTKPAALITATKSKPCALGCQEMATETTLD
jgi:hypothetical protein